MRTDPHEYTITSSGRPSAVSAPDSSTEMAEKPPAQDQTSLNLLHATSGAPADTPFAPLVGIDP